MDARSDGIRNESLRIFLSYLHSYKRSAKSAEAQAIFDKIPLDLLSKIRKNDYGGTGKNPTMSFLTEPEKEALLDVIGDHLDELERFVDSPAFMSRSDQGSVDSEGSQISNQGSTSSEDLSVDDDESDAQLIEFLSNIHHYHLTRINKDASDLRDIRDVLNDVNERYPEFYSLAEQNYEQSQAKPDLSRLGPDDKAALLVQMQSFHRELDLYLYGKHALMSHRKDAEGKLHSKDELLIHRFLKAGASLDVVHKWIDPNVVPMPKDTVILVRQKKSPQQKGHQFSAQSESHNSLGSASGVKLPEIHKKI